MRRIVLAILLILLGTGIFVGTVGNLWHKSYLAALLLQEHESSCLTKL